MATIAALLPLFYIRLCHLEECFECFRIEKASYGSLSTSCCTDDVSDSVTMESSESQIHELNAPPKLLKSDRNPIGKDRFPIPPFFQGINSLLNFWGSFFSRSEVLFLHHLHQLGPVDGRW